MVIGCVVIKLQVLYESTSKTFIVLADRKNKTKKTASYYFSW